MLADGHARQIEYVRLSVTDLCNLRCAYCMPLEGAVKQARTDILSYEEMARLIGMLVQLGVRSVRVTGGEPLLRKNITELIELLSEIPELEDILLTTNGYKLKELAPELKAAGLKRINVHLDTLDAQRYEKITHGGQIKDVLSGIESAQAAGLGPVKINSVLMKGLNDDEIDSMVRFAADNKLLLRFIELMPLGPAQTMQDQFLPTSYVLERLSRKWQLVPYGKRLGRGPAEYYKIAELDSIVGLIHAVSEPFCHKCNRIRIAADGRIQDCLAYDESDSLRTLLRTPGIADETIIETVKLMIGMKREDHGGFLLPQYNATCGMYGIGG